MKIYALILLCLTSWLTLSGCESTRIVEKPVPVEVVRVERVPVPADLLIRHIKVTIPPTLTYGEAIQLWAEDRAIVDKLNGQLQAIEVLNDGSRGNDH
jgi:hypothetical protein